MKKSNQVWFGVVGAAVMMFAGAVSAQTFDDIYVHGNACVGGGASTSSYGATNSSTTSSATVNCPIQAAWPAPGNSNQQRWLQLTYWNRSSTAGAFTCKVVGLDESGNKVYDPGNVTIPTGAPNSAPSSFNIGQPPVSARYFNVNCTIPKSSGAGGGSSFISGIVLRIAS